MPRRYFEALALLSGTIIGVGVFAMPFAISQAGVIAGIFELLILSGVVLLIHLMYGDVVLSRDTIHQLPGYTKSYLGPIWQTLVVISSVIGLLGSLVVYIILGSRFLAILIAPLAGASSHTLAFVLFGVGGAVFFFYDTSLAEEANGVFTALLLLFMLFLIGIGIHSGTFDFIYKTDLARIAIPYGIILFALTGASVIPEVKTTLENEKAFRSVIVWGSLIPAVLYLFFVVAVLAASGPLVTQDAITGLQARLGSHVGYLGALIGFLAVITSYIGMGLTFKSLLISDFGARKSLSWLLTSLVPFFLVALGLSDFVKIIGFVGALAIGFESMVIVYIWRKLPFHRLLPYIPRGLSFSLVVLFFLGMMYELVVFLS